MNQQLDQYVERRKRPRLPVHWNVYLSGRFENHHLQSKTENLSSEGFYCYVAEPILPGATLEFTVAIPNHNGEDRQICLQGSALVVRFEHVDGGYGIGCIFKDYRIVTCMQSDVEAWMMAGR